jgi:hypothetical protein
MAVERDEFGRILPGSVLNPEGRKKRGAYFEEWADAMCKWKEADLRRVAEDVEEEAEKRAAAKHTLRRMEDGFSKSGVPYAFKDMEFSADRSLGKPKQEVSVTTREEVSWEVVQRELIALFRENPELIPGGLALPEVIASDAPENGP